MGINRKIQPPIQAIIQPELPEHRIVELDNGLKMYVLHFPASEILKVEFDFHVGRPEEEQRMTAYMTPRLMREGAGTHTGAAIAEHFDYYGTAMSNWNWLDATGFILTGLSKYAAQTIPLFSEVLLQPTFPPHELDIVIQTHIQELQVELEKVEIISYRVLTERLYGANHPLGYNSTAEDYRAITSQSLMQFYQKHLQLHDAFVFLSGHVSEEVIALMNQYFGQVPLQPSAQPARIIPPPEPSLPKGKNKKMVVVQPGALQSAIKSGRMLFNRQHPDFYEIQVLNTILGGYFGSRLMANIREDKGYTYNIYSGIDTYYETGYLYISTEVNRDKTTATQRSIRAEMKKLREQLVSEEELTMVRNYMTGALLNGMDGPLNMSAVVRSLIFERLGKEGLQRQLLALQTITPERIQALAQQYLQPEDFLTVIVKGNDL